MQQNVAAGSLQTLTRIDSRRRAGRSDWMISMIGTMESTDKTPIGADDREQIGKLDVTAGLAD